jgi:hypothetical protein
VATPVVRPRRLERALIALLGMGMWVSWLTPLFHLLLHSGLLYPGGIDLPAGVLLAILAGAGLLRGALAGRARGPALGAVAGAAAVAVATGVVVGVDVWRLGAWLRLLGAILARPGQGWPAPLVVAIICGLAWLWGLAATWGDYGELFTGYLTGVVGFGVALLAPPPAFWEAAALPVVGYLAAFIITSLLSLGLASARATQGTGDGVAAGVPRPGREWFLAVGGVVLGVLAVGWLAAPLIAPEVPRRVADWLRPAGRWVEAALSYLLYGLAYVVFVLLAPLIDGIIALFRAIASRLSEALAGALEGFLADWGRAAEEGVRDPASAGAGAEVLGVVRVLVIALLAGALVAAFWYGLRRFRPRRGGAVEERESVFSRALLRAQLEGLFTRRGRRPPEPYLPLEGEGPRARIRRLYRAFLAHAAAWGEGHPPSATPCAYARRLERTLPAEAGALEALTSAYVQARYAMEEPSPAVVAGAEAAWERLARALSTRAG